MSPNIKRAKKAKSTRLNTSFFILLNKSVAKIYHTFQKIEHTKNDLPFLLIFLRVNSPPLAASELLSTALLSDLLFHGPINSLLKPQFYYKEEWMKDNQDLLKRVPKNPDISVASQNNLVPHITHRESAYRIPFGLNSEYMIFDLADGPNKYAPLDQETTKNFVQELLDSKRYSIVYQKGNALLLKRNYKTDITKSPYFNDTRYCYYSFEEK